MKSIFFFFLTITTITLWGQNHLLGVKGGVSWTNVTASNFAKDRNFRTGFAIGFTYDYIFKKHFSTGADIIYNQQGFTIDNIFVDELGNPTGKKATSKFNYDYISIPLKAGFNYGKTIFGFANIGLTPSILIVAKTTTPTIDFYGTTIQGETFNITDRVNKFDIGGLVEIGGGYKFKGRYWLFTSFSYQHSFTSITNAEYLTNSKIRHYGFTLNLGLKCALTKA